MTASTCCEANSLARDPRDFCHGLLYARSDDLSALCGPEGLAGGSVAAPGTGPLHLREP